MPIEQSLHCLEYSYHSVTQCWHSKKRTYVEACLSRVPVLHYKNNKSNFIITRLREQLFKNADA